MEPTAINLLVARLRDACNGHPHAKIPWPHRILHEAADALTAAEARVAQLESDLAASRAEREKMATTAVGAVGDLSDRVAQLETALPGDHEWQLLLSAVENLRGGSSDPEQRTESAWRIAAELAKWAKAIDAARTALSQSPDRESGT